MRRGFHRLHRLAPALSVALIGGIALAASFRPGAKLAAPFQARVRKAVDAMPARVGPWIGSDTKIPDAAVKLLKPNTIRSRVFRNLRTGRTATLLVVQCRDARDLAGHYPPICYPAAGWTITHTSPHTWHAGGLALPGIRYTMRFPRPGDPARQVVADFMIMPDGRVLPDMGGVREAAADYTIRFFGAAEVQVIVPADLPPAEQNRIIERLLQGHAHLLRVLGSAKDHPAPDPDAAPGPDAAPSPAPAG